MKIFIILAIIVLTSCVNKSAVQKAQPYFEQNSSKNVLQKSITTIHKDDGYLDLAQPVKISQAIDFISRIEGYMYHIEENSLIYDSFLKSNPYSQRLDIDTFDKLKAYIEETSEYTIDITKNRYIDPKQIKIVTISPQYDKRLKSIHYNIEGMYNISQILQKIAQKSGFSLIYKPFNESVQNSNPQAYFDLKEVYLKGSNLLELINQLKTMLNIFIDINFDKKQIIISKYQLRHYTTLAQHINTNYDTTTETKSSVNNSANYNEANNLENSINSLLKGSDPIVQLSYDKDKGLITLYADKNSIEKVEKIINHFNENAKKQVKAVVTVYEFLIDEQKNLGINSAFSNKDVQINSKSIIDNFIQYTISGSSNTININSDNSFIKKGETLQYPTILTNNRPETISVITQKDIFKDIVTTTKKVDNETQTTSQIQTNKVKEGINITIYPTIYTGYISIKLFLNINKINDIKPYKTGDKTTFLTETTTTQTTENFLIKRGERKIIKQYTTYAKTNSNKGALPFRSFIFGESNQNFRKKEVVVVFEIN